MVRPIHPGDWKWLHEIAVATAKHVGANLPIDPDDALDAAMTGAVRAWRRYELTLWSPKNYIQNSARWALLDYAKREMAEQAKLRRLAEHRPRLPSPSAADEAADREEQQIAAESVRKWMRWLPKHEARAVRAAFFSKIALTVEARTRACGANNRDEYFKWLREAMVKLKNPHWRAYAEQRSVKRGR